MGKIGDNMAVELLVEALKDENWNVQKNAAEALGKIGDKRAIDPLMEALKDEDGHVCKKSCKKSIRRDKKPLTLLGLVESLAIHNQSYL